MAASQFKNFLYAFCGKRKVRPIYTERPCAAGTFKFQIQIEGFDYVGLGSATNKKDAETNAAKDFCGFLIGAGIIPADSFPDDLFGEGPTAPASAVPAQQQQQLPSSVAPAPQSQFMPNQNQQPGPAQGKPFQSQPPSLMMQQGGSGSGASNEMDGWSGAGQRDYHYSMYNKRKFEEAEDVDLNAHLHGNWTLVNAKSRLHQYLQQNRIPADFKYSAGGPDHNRHFVAELSIFVKSHRRSISSREHASTKKQAAQNTSLSLVRQLFHMGVMEAAEPGQLQPKRKKVDEIERFDVGISPEMEQQVSNLLQSLEIQPVPQPEDPTQDAKHDTGSGIVEWTPPNMNWNPWINQPMIIEGAEEYQIAKYGPNSVLFVGILLGGTAVILFGFCGRMSGTAAFVVLSFLLRSISAIGGAASETSVMSIIIAEFPDNLGMASGFIETSIGVGLSLGPCLGGALYSAGGFQLPFFVIGSSMFVPIPVFFYVLSNKGKTPSQEKTSFSIIKALKIPAVLIVAGCCVTGGIMFTFVEPILGPHLEKTMNQNTTQIGMVFLVNAATYAIVTPLAGWIGDKTKCYRWLTVPGFICAGFAYLLLGPAPFLTFILPTKSVWLVYVAMLVNGFSWACFLVQLVPQLVQIIRDEGIPDNSATSAVVASIFNFMFYLGATIGPTLAGILDEHIGFQWTMVVASSISFSQAVILIAFTLLEETEVGSRIKSYSSDGEEELMLDSKHKQENGYYRSLDG